MRLLNAGSRWRCALAVGALTAAVLVPPAPVHAQPAPLPQARPVEDVTPPRVRPQTGSAREAVTDKESEGTGAADTAAPEPTAADVADPQQTAVEAAATPLPAPRPDPPPVPKRTRLAASAPRPPRPPLDPDAEAACRLTLTALGVEFEELDAIDGPGACGIAAPLRVTALGPGVTLSPASELNCRTAAALATWVQRALAPAARTLLDAEPAGIVHNTTYFCRSRNNVAGARISEHAFGNAVDIARVTFEDREPVVIGDHPAGSPEEAFQRTVRARACEHFKTVLGPGTDAAHSDHFHLDMSPRRSGRYCR